jgi:hypothetical protein
MARPAMEPISSDADCLSVLSAIFRFYKFMDSAAILHHLFNNLRHAFYDDHLVIIRHRNYGIRCFLDILDKVAIHGNGSFV